MVKSRLPMNSNRRPRIGSQRGAALIVGLIMLLLMTMVGVAGMRDTLLQEKMAGNMRDREMALQAAESALRAAEISLNGATAPAISNANGMYDLATTAGATATQRKSGSTMVSEPKFWGSVWNWYGNGNYITYGSVGTVRQLPMLNPALASQGILEQPRYVIEKMDSSLTNRGEYTSGGGSTTMVTEADLGSVEDTATVVPDYRITARGVGATADAVVILQSTFRRSKP